MNDRCPSELALEQHLARHEAASGHLATCARCAARLVEMRGEGEEFRRFVYPRTLEAVLEPTPRRRWSRWLLAAPATGLAAAALLLLVARPSAPPDDYTGVKGGALGFSVFAGDAAGARPVEDGAKVGASASLRFRVHPSAACHLWVLSIDAGGEVSRIYPTAGEGGAPIRGTAALPGGAVLDGRPGAERLFAVCAPQPLPWGALSGSAHAAAAKGIREARTLPGLPEGAMQATLLLEKTP